MRVRSGETPRSPVVKPPCVVERPGSKRGGATDQSVTSREACSVVTPVRHHGGRGGAEPFPKGRRPWTTPGILERVSRNLPAQGARNGQKVVLGTGEILLGPGSAVREAVLSITGDPGKCQAAERKSEGALVVMMDRTTQPVRSEGPLLHRCTTEMWRDPDECRTLG